VRAPARAAGSSTRSTAPRTTCAGYPVWATLIALMERGEGGDRPVVGVVSARPWAAAGGRPKGTGAYTGRSLSSATRLHVSKVTAELRDASFAYSSLSGWEERGRLDGFLDLTRACWRTRALRRLLAVHDGRRGVGGHLRGAGAVAVGHGGERGDRPARRAAASPGSTACPARTAATRRRRTGCCTARCWTTCARNGGRGGCQSGRISVRRSGWASARPCCAHRSM
jgi:hypothetical protein